MTCEQAQILLNDFVDGLLAEDQRRQLERHLSGCEECRADLHDLHALLNKAAHLPKAIAPPHDLWPAIHKQINPQRTSRIRWANFSLTETNNVPQSPRGLANKNSYHIRTRRWKVAPFMIAAISVLTCGGMWFILQSQKPSWDVASLSGAPMIGTNRIEKNGRWTVGEWLATDAVSRAQINIGMIGKVEVAPNTRIRLLQAQLTDHRLDLAHGKIHATIWAPPRLFFVETAAALAIDLGCEYTLQVEDDGSGLLHVTAGYVALESYGRESVVPAGAFCAMRPGLGPGTPYAADASMPLREALAKIDFAHGGVEELAIVLDEARFADTFTLWHLLVRVAPMERPRVYDRMTELIPPPPGVTRDGVLRGDKKMLDKWAETFGLGYSWWRHWLPL